MIWYQGLSFQAPSFPESRAALQRLLDLHITQLCDCKQTHWKDWKLKCWFSNSGDTRSASQSSCGGPCPGSASECLREGLGICISNQSRWCWHTLWESLKQNTLKILFHCNNLWWVVRNLVKPIILTSHFHPPATQYTKRGLLLPWEFQTPQKWFQRHVQVIL